MFENLKVNFGKFKETVKEKAADGWNGLKDKMGKIRDRWDIFSEETKAELFIVTAPVVNGVKQAAEGIKTSYNAVEGNIFKRIGNVFKEGWGEMKEKVATIRENVGEKVARLKERYQVLGFGVGTLSLVHDAMDRVEELPIYIQAGMEVFQEKKLNLIGDKAEKAVSKDATDKKNDRLISTYAHVANRRNYFENKRMEMTDKLQRMRQGRSRLVAAMAQA
ncbi:MAG: hypothetical protein NTY75_00320 [Candidatus Shapirobacteria bacterium]|nr:hypothetical protein [Candidatus Shapirobacteria bacterium]